MGSEYQIYYTKTGGIHDMSKKEFEYMTKFHKMFKYKSVWRNRRGDIYAWEKKN